MERKLRSAEPTDFEVIAALDKEVTGSTVDRSERIARAIADSRCTVVTSNSTIQGFAISNPKAFREMDFLDLVVVNPSTRRQGIATRLITHFKQSSKTPECWTSTNQSNQAMLSLLRKLGWYKSDHVEELDAGDPELFFFIK